MHKSFKIIGLILFVLISLEQTIAQDSRILKYDSLIRIEESDTAKIRLVLLKLDVLSTINLDSAINLAEQTLEEAQKINFYDGKVGLLTSLMNNYLYKGNFDAARNQVQQLEQTIVPGKDSLRFANLFGNLGMFYGMQSKYDSSIYFFKKAISISERAGSNNGMGTYYSNIAIGYQQQSNFPMALQYQQKSLKLYQELGNNESGQAYTLVNMASTYHHIGDYKRAESSFLESIELAKKVKLANVELYGYSNLASLYTDEKKWQESYDYAMKAAELGGEMGDQGIQSASLSKASTALVNLGQPKKAIALSKKAIKLVEASLAPLNTYQAYVSMGFALMSQGAWAEAIPFFEKGFKSIKDADMYTINIGLVTQQLSECYEKTGNYSKALELFKRSTAIADSVSRKENIRKATEQTMNFEFEKKIHEAKVIQDAKDEIIETRQLALIIGLLLSLVIIFGAFIGYFSKKKANVLLLNQKMEVEKTLAKLKNTQAQLIQSEKMASLGELTAGIAHEIQNPLNFVNNFSEVSNELIDEMNEELDKKDIEEAKIIAKDIKENLEKITHHGKRADAIVKGMLAHSRSGKGEKASTDLNALAEEYLKLSYHGLRAKDKSFNADFKTDFDSNLPKMEVVPQDIGRVLLNLINNAFQASSAKALPDRQAGLAKVDSDFQPLVTVRTKKTGNGIKISVSDNGPGIPDDIKDKIFQPFFTTKPTGQGTGLGLSLSYDIVKAHGGELKLKAGEGEGLPAGQVGSTFIIQLPI
jgi:signal transduction histidine kinase